MSFEYHKWANEMYAAIQKKRELNKKNSFILEFLEIPFDENEYTVDASDLVEILTNTEKLKNLNSKLKIKMFW